ncbi:hypothetical protein [Kribbella sp. NPDC004875]|uniref:hypothetical protein n=1 Tax=Kribbella sp. NPDC004875 TaxID=3364107 RepID=UPI0036A02C37
MSSNEARFGVIHMSGGRYERPGLPLASAEELRRYERLVGRLARSLFMRDHRHRKRAPRGFTTSVVLRLTAIESGSVIPVLERDNTSTDDFAEIPDYYESARQLINSALRTLDSPIGRLDPDFPVDCLKDFAAFGRGLRDDEVIEFWDEQNKQPARFNVAARRKIQTLASLDHLEVELVLQGQITGLRSSPQQFDFVQAGTGRRIIGTFSDPATWDDLRDFQGYAERAPMASLAVVADQSQNGEILAISEVLNVEAALPIEWAKRIEELSQLRSSWLHDGTPPPSPDALDAAEQLLLACVDDNIKRPGIFPTPDGGIQLEWALDNVEIEIEFPETPRSNARGFWFARGSDAEEEIECAPDDVDTLLDFIRGGMNA